MEGLLEILQIYHLLPCADIFVQLSRLYTLLPLLDDDSDEIAEVILPVMHLFEMAQTTFILLMSVFKTWKAMHTPIGRIVNELFPGGQRHGYQEVWPLLSQNPFRFWYLTGETVDSLQELADALPDDNHTGRHHTLTKRDALLLTTIWLRQYPTLIKLGTLFDITISTCHHTIESMVFKLHFLLAREIRWHNAATWRLLAGRYIDFPSVVGIIDGTIIRINIPTGIKYFIFLWSNDY
jgi:hypothetical protein